MQNPSNVLCGDDEQNMKMNGTKLRPVLLLLCFGAFLLYAVYFNSFGANAETTMAFFSIDETANGFILTVQAVGCMGVTILLGLFGERLNKINGIAAGLLLMGGAGIAIGMMPVYLHTGSYSLMLALSLAAGVGYMTIDLLMNSVIADVFPAEKNRLLPYVHAFYGIGAMLAPMFVTNVVRPEAPDSFGIPYLYVGVGAAAVAAALFAVSRGVTPDTPYAHLKTLGAKARSNPAEIFREKKAWLFLLSGYLYLCFQTGLTTWLPSYCAQVRGEDFTSAGLNVTAYFLGALVMRFLSPVLYRYLGVSRFYRGSLLTSAVLFLVYLLVPMPELSGKMLLAVIGLLQGASVPSLVILCCDAFPTRTASASSIVVFGVSLAAMTAPTIMGAVMESSGHQTAMLLSTLCLPLAVLALPRVQASVEK